jgi:hypothetical protein
VGSSELGGGSRGSRGSTVRCPYAYKLATYGTTVAISTIAQFAVRCSRSELVSMVRVSMVGAHEQGKEDVWPMMI